MIQSDSLIEKIILEHARNVKNGDSFHHLNRHKQMHPAKIAATAGFRRFQILNIILFFIIFYSHKIKKAFFYKQKAAKNGVYARITPIRATFYTFII